MTTDTITLTGLVATTPRYLTTSEGLTIASFRLASSKRRYDRGLGRWVDGDTNWYTVSAFRSLADNVSESVNKGDRVFVQGRLRLREWGNDNGSGMTVEVEADIIGHDLCWNKVVATRVQRPAEEVEGK